MLICLHGGTLALLLPACHQRLLQSLCNMQKGIVESVAKMAEMGATVESASMVLVVQEENVENLVLVESAVRHFTLLQKDMPTSSFHR